MDACQYIFINKGARMSAGKVAAQAGHAAIEGYRLTEQRVVGSDHVIAAWYEGGGYKKIVLEARDDTHLLTIHHYLNERGIYNKLIIDEGHTEVDPHTATAIGTVVVDKDDPHVAATFSGFKLFREPRPADTEEREAACRQFEQAHDYRRRWWHFLYCPEPIPEGGCSRVGKST